MRFKHESGKSKAIGEIFYMVGSPDQLCLNLYTDDDSMVVTIYSDGEVTYQKKTNFTWHDDPFSPCDEFVRYIYAGDKLSMWF